MRFVEGNSFPRRFQKGVWCWPLHCIHSLAAAEVAATAVAVVAGAGAAAIAVAVAAADADADADADANAVGGCTGTAADDAEMSQGLSCNVNQPKRCCEEHQ